MSAVTDAVPATAPQGAVVQSVRDSLVRDRRPNALKEQAK